MYIYSNTSITYCTFLFYMYLIANICMVHVSNVKFTKKNKIRFGVIKGEREYGGTGNREYLREAQCQIGVRRHQDRRPTCNFNSFFLSFFRLALFSFKSHPRTLFLISLIDLSFFTPNCMPKLNSTLLEYFICKNIWNLSN